MLSICPVLVGYPLRPRNTLLADCVAGAAVASAAIKEKNSGRSRQTAIRDTASLFKFFSLP